CRVPHRRRTEAETEHCRTWRMHCRPCRPGHRASRAPARRMQTLPCLLRYLPGSPRKLIRAIIEGLSPADSFMCGIIGIVGTSNVAPALYDGLTVLQHRGQDAAGIATTEGQRMHLHRGKGLVRDVFTQKTMARLLGRIGIGHCRYPTAGGDEEAGEAQPFYVNSPYGIAFAHNGNLVNT